jgi:PAS domain S-box-containing protein
LFSAGTYKVTLLFRLFLLVAIALLPVIGIQAYNEFALLRSRQLEAQDQALATAKLAAAEQQQFIQGIRQVLIALSEFPGIKAKDIPACSAYLSAIKERYPAFLSFFVTDTTGATFCNTVGANHLPVSAAGRPYISVALQTGDFRVGEYSVGRISGRNVIDFAMPFYDDDRHVKGAVVAALSLDWLAANLASKNVPPGGAISILDRDGTYLARYPDNGRFVGTKAPNSDTSNATGQGVSDTHDRDGVERITGYSTLGDASGDLRISFGLEKAQLFEPIHSSAERGFILIIVSTLLVLALTWLGARRFIHRPLAQLVEAANHWRFGDYAGRVAIQPRQPEFARVGDAFNMMADTLVDRENELRGAKENAEAAAAQITTIFESTTDSVIIVDRDWRITYLNERARMQVADGRSLIGKRLRELFPRPLNSDIISRFRAVMSGGRPASFEIFSEGKNVWYDVNAYPSSPGVAIYFRDITEHRLARESRRLMEEQLHQSQKMEAVGQLTGGIAHDFNNLLMLVVSNLELIGRHAGADDTVRQFAAAAHQAADRGANLTAQLLSFSRRQPLDPKLVHAGQLINEFQGLIRQAVGEGCDIRLSIDDCLWLCHVDSAQLETALLNLALNGRDAMPDAGVLEIAARNVVLEENDAGGLAGGPYISISVRDTGCGMPPETVERVFEPFFTTKEVGMGTGLGLSMVYGFVKQSQGHIAIDSVVGAGTTVTLYLPTKPPVCPMPEDGADRDETVPTGSNRILLIDDDEQLLQLVSSILIDLGYTVLCTQNAADALKVLRSETPIDAMFSDIMLPNGMSGVDLAREARRLRGEIRILLTSGHGHNALSQNGALEDEFTFICKPFSRRVLARSLRSLLHEA